MLSFFFFSFLHFLDCFCCLHIDLLLFLVFFINWFFDNCMWTRWLQVVEPTFCSVFFGASSSMIVSVDFISNFGNILTNSWPMGSDCCDEICETLQGLFSLIKIVTEITECLAEVFHGVFIFWVFLWEVLELSIYKSCHIQLYEIKSQCTMYMGSPMCLKFHLPGVEKNSHWIGSVCDNIGDKGFNPHVEIASCGHHIPFNQLTEGCFYIFS